MNQAKISKAGFCNGYPTSAEVDFDNGDSLFLYGYVELTSFVVQDFSLNEQNYNSCEKEEIRKLVDYVENVINDDFDETHALFIGDIKIYLDFSKIKGKNK